MKKKWAARCPKAFRLFFFFQLSTSFFFEWGAFPLFTRLAFYMFKILGLRNLSNNGLGLLLGLGALTESVLEATVDIGQVAHAAGTGGLSADALIAPVVCWIKKNKSRKFGQQCDSKGCIQLE